MKQIKFLVTALTFSGIFFFSSCNSGDESNSANPPANPDSASAKKTEPSVPVKPANVLIIKHKVGNFAKWKAGYEAGDSLRLAYGLHNYVIGRGVADSTMVMVAVKMDDAAKAKAFTALPELDANMKKAGVKSKPEIMFIDVQMMDSATNNITQRVMVTHKVKDWDAFKKVFDSHKQTRVDAGLSDRAVGYEFGNNKMVMIVGAVSDMKKAQDFFGSKDLKDKMAEAGVDGPPTIFFYNVVQRY